MKTVFVDVDTQYDFLFPAGALSVPGAQRILPAVSRLNHWAARNGAVVVSTMDAHTENDREFQVWPGHCVAGTLGQRKHESTLLERRVTIPSHRTSFDLAGAQQSHHREAVAQLLRQRQSERGAGRARRGPLRCLWRGHRILRGARGARFVEDGQAGGHRVRCHRNAEARRRRCGITRFHRGGRDDRASGGHRRVESALDVPEGDLTNPAPLVFHPSKLVTLYLRGNWTGSHSLPVPTRS